MIAQWLVDKGVKAAQVTDADMDWAYEDLRQGLGRPPKDRPLKARQVRSHLNDARSDKVWKLMQQIERAPGRSKKEAHS